MEKATFFDRLAVYRPVHGIVVRKAFCASSLFFSHAFLQTSRISPFMDRMQMYMCMMGMYTLCVHTPRCGLVG